VDNYQGLFFQGYGRTVTLSGCLRWARASTDKSLILVDDRRFVSWLTLPLKNIPRVGYSQCIPLSISAGESTEDLKLWNREILTGCNSGGILTIATLLVPPSSNRISLLVQVDLGVGKHFAGENLIQVKSTSHKMTHVMTIASNIAHRELNTLMISQIGFSGVIRSDWPTTFIPAHSSFFLSSIRSTKSLSDFIFVTCHLWKLWIYKSGP